MERTRKTSMTPLTNSMLKAFASELVARNELAVKTGMSMFSGRRDLYTALGYPETITFDDYLSRFTRQDIARAIIDRPVTATWQGDLEMIETDDAEETPFEKAWRKLNYDFQLKGILERVDRLTGIGRYGVILLGLDDVRTQEDFGKPVRVGKRNLLYIKPFSEKTATIVEFETNPSNKRYGFPLIYNVEVADAASGASQQVKVHYSRIIHITDNSMESEIYGSPRLEAVYNRLFDIEKIVGGDGEMFWRGARPGYKGKLDPEYTMTADAKAALEDEIEEYENNLRRFLINEGIDLQGLEQQIADPKNHLDVQLTLISARTGIPKRILSGSERGELASTQDVGEWKTYVKARRENQAEPRIIRPLVNRLIELMVLPKPKDEYRVDWEDLFAISELARVEIGKGRANSLREYTYNPLAAAIVPPEGFLEFFLGFTRQQIELMKQMKSDDILQEVKELMDGPDEEDGDEPAKPKPTKPTKK